MKNHYAILGTGAIGGFIAAKLYQAGCDVHCLLRSDYDQVKQHGLHLESPDGDIDAKIHAYHCIDDMPICDVILLTWKATSNNLLKDFLPKIMHKDSLVVNLQNGIGTEDLLATFIKPEQIIGGVCFIKATKVNPGYVRHFKFNMIELAQYYRDPKKEALTSAVAGIVHEFSLAGIKAKAHAHLSFLQWRKLAGNVPFSAISILENKDYRELSTDPHCLEQIIKVTKELFLAARACGANLPDSFLDDRMKVLDDFKQLPGTFPSLKDDFDAGRPLELEAFFLNPIKIAKAHGFAMPLTQGLYDKIIKRIKQNTATKPATHDPNSA